MTKNSAMGRRHRSVAKRARWREENREAIAAYNDYVDEYGAFSDGIRSF